MCQLFISNLNFMMSDHRHHTHPHGHHDDNDDDAVEDEEAGKELEEKAVSKGDGRAPHDNLVAGRKESRSVGTTSLSTSKTQQANAAQMNTNENPKGDSYGVGGRGVRMPKVL